MTIETLLIMFAGGFLAWGAAAVDRLHRRPLTEYQKLKAGNAQITLGAVFSGILALEFGAAYFLFADVQTAAAGLFAVNFFGYLFFPKNEKDRKQIRARQLSNFAHLKPKKFWNFEKNIKEIDIDRYYYFFKTVHKKSDMTIERLELGKALKLEYKMFLKELKKPFEKHLVYEELTNYINNVDPEYRIEKLDPAALEGGTRAEAERIIFRKFKELREARIPIRISQLIQYSKDRKYLSNFIYFLMCTESRKYVPKAVLYAIYFAGVGRKRRAKK